MDLRKPWNTGDQHRNREPVSFDTHHIVELNNHQRHRTNRGAAALGGGRDTVTPIFRLVKAQNH